MNFDNDFLSGNKIEFDNSDDKIRKTNVDISTIDKEMKNKDPILDFFPSYTEENVKLLNSIKNSDSQNSITITGLILKNNPSVTVLDQNYLINQTSEKLFNKSDT